jgi:recombination protein RecR
VTPTYDKLLQSLKRLPGVGYRAAERIAMHLLVAAPGQMEELQADLEAARSSVRRCATCGNLAEAEACSVCLDAARDGSRVCVVEQAQDLIAIERSGAWRGCYHVLHGKLSPIHGIGPERLNFEALRRRIEAGVIEEMVFALSNDIEGQATCHYIQEELVAGRSIQISRIGFGLPSGGGVTYADPVTLRSALEGRTRC